MQRSSEKKTEIRERLLALAEPEYQKFSSSLLPGVENVLGVRLPKLRKLAEQLCNSLERITKNKKMKKREKSRKTPKVTWVPAFHILRFVILNENENERVS